MKRLTWQLKRIFSVNDVAWKDYLCHQLKSFGGLFLFHCNYNVIDHPISSQVYTEMLQSWWADFRDEFSTEKYWHSIIWNGQDVRLLFYLSNLDSYNIISKQVGKVNFLTWRGLRHAIPSNLKMGNYTFMKPLATSFSTVYTRSLFGKSLNFIFILIQKNLSLFL